MTWNCIANRPPPLRGHEKGMTIVPPPLKFYMIISRIECNPMILTIFRQWEYRSVGLYILMSQTRPSQANNLVCQFDSMTVLPVYSSSCQNYSDTSNALQVHTTCGIKSFREAACLLMCKPVSSQYSLAVTFFPSPL